MSLFLACLYILFVRSEKTSYLCTRNQSKVLFINHLIFTIMKSFVWIVVQSVITEDGKESKCIHSIYLFKSQAQDRMNEIVVEFEDKQDDQGNFIWECERPWWNIANFKSNTHDFSMRIEVIEREIEI